MSNRLTIDRVTFQRLQTQLAKDTNKPVALLLASARTSVLGNANTVIWDPSAELLEGIKAILERELTFMRNPGSTNATRMKDTIAACQKLLKTSQSPIAPGESGKPASTTTSGSDSGADAAS